MAGISVDITNNAKAHTFLWLQKIRQETLKSAHWAGNRLVKSGVEALDKNDTGTLRKSITYNVRNSVKGIKVTFGTNAKHAIFVHEGTKPHWTPVTPIRKWVKRKFKIRNEKKLNRVTFAVRRKIAVKGTEANPFITQAVNSQFGWIQKRFKSIPGKVAKQVNPK